MTNQYIYGLAQDIIEEYGTTDPEEICSQLDVFVYKDDDLGDVPGFISIFRGEYFIVVNNDIPEEEQRLVIAHELGHFMLHKDILDNFGMFREFGLYDLQRKPEHEAYCFAVSLLISDEEMIECLKERQLSLYETASVLGIDVRMVTLKFDFMRNLKRI